MLLILGVVSNPIVLNVLRGAIRSENGKIRSKRRLSKQKYEKLPGYTVNAPPSITFWGKHPGAEVASHLSVGGGAVSKAGKGMLYIGKLICG